MFEIYLDEAGYTGSDLLSKDQPVYALAGIALSNEVALELAAKCFSNVKARELRHSSLSFRRRGREQIIEFVEALAQHPTSASVTVMHKEYALLGLLIDYWVEPAMRLDGIKLYERGANIGFVNLAFMTLGALLGIEGRREFLRQFQVMVRDRTTFAYESFWSTVKDLYRNYPQFGDLFGTFMAADLRLGLQYLIKLPKHVFDMGDYSLLETVNHWRGNTEEELSLIHDNNTALARRKDLWEAWLSDKAPPAVVGQDRRVIRFPLDAKIRLAESTDYLRLQLADIIAGATTSLLHPNTGRTPKHPSYVEDLRKGSLLKCCLIGGVWPSDKVSPDDLDTEGPMHRDAAEYLASLIPKN